MDSDVVQELHRLQGLQKQVNAQSWNHISESFIQSWGEKASGNRTLHLVDSVHWDRVSNIGSLVVIISSTLCGMFTLTNSFSVYVVGAMNFVGTLCATMLKFYKPEIKAQHHLQTAQRYGELYRKIAFELSQSRSDRSHSDEISRIARDRYDTIQNNAPTLRESTILWMKNRVPTPDANVTGHVCYVPDVFEVVQHIEINKTPTTTQDQEIQ